MAYTEKHHQAKVNAFEDVTIALRNLYDAKNRDYGDSFGKSFQEWGMPMACIRLTDKLNRLCALTKSGEQRVQDESIEDTLRDLANYSIMTLIEIERRKREQDEG